MGAEPEGKQRERRALAALVLAGAALAWASACDPVELQLCGQIPDGGCPIGRGGTCDDPFCAALYDCVEGSWTLVEECPDNLGGGGGDGPGGAPPAGGGGEGGCVPAVIDHSAEVSGCEPDLQEPDCPAAAAEVCPDPCLTGCVDFYLCEERGWTTVAFCDEDGALVVEQVPR